MSSLRRLGRAAALTAPQQGVYDLEYESGAGVVTRILEGRFYVKSEATT